MHEILLIGLNHKSAPVEVRECLAFDAEESVTATAALKRLEDVSEAVLISTCNRVEALLVTQRAEGAIKATKAFLAANKNLALDRFEDHLYLYRGEEAVKHIFRVAASLDSLVVGEPQILGQIKAAYRSATQEKASGPILNRLLHRTFFVAKRIRTETGIGDHAVSISYAAIELARKIFGGLEAKQVLLIGAGEMAELAVEHLLRQRSGTISVANRTFERAVELARSYKGTALRFEEIPAALETVDIIISSTGAPGVVIERKQVKGVMRKRRNRPLFFIDIAVPRDIDPAINRLNNAYVYDIDDLKGVVDENLEDRQREAIRAERIIDEAAIHFKRWLRSLEVVPTIVALRNQFDAVAQAEIQKALQGLAHLTDADRKAIERMTHAITQKLLHGPTRFLKSDGCQAEGNRSAVIDIVQKLFELEP
ncbi:MAG: glutamyl-tRNA reductase [Desulfosarcinaceae bacterium]|jgi:glutamyl-tRNA reductase